MLTVRRLTKRYGKTVALEDVSLEVEAGSVLAVIGANGAGKTTLIKSIVGLVHFEGEVTLGGIDVSRDPKAARRLLGYLPQHSALPPDLTVQETAAFFSQLRGVPAAQAAQAVEAAGLEDHATKYVSELSGGMNQRLGLALALLGDPPLLILDEPAAGLDVSARIDLRRLVDEQRNAGKAIVLSTHWVEDVPYVADQALLLDRGHTVYSGPAARLATEQAAASRLYLRLNGRTPEALTLVRDSSSVRTVDPSGDWLVITCATGEKARIIEALVTAGITILDFRVEEAPVGEAVLRMKDLREARP